MLPIRLDDLDDETIAIVESSLPTSAVEFVRLIGLRATLALLAQFGGMEFTLPKSATGPGGARFDQIAGAIGIDKAEKLAHWFDGERLYIPRALRAMAALRNRQLVVDYSRLMRSTSARHAANSLAFDYRMSYRSVEKIVNGETARSRVNPPAKTR
jgi:hypothetical protein